ncbi:MAG: leucyl/phenylalanyl-tRNA--protein transferase [Solirubrobacterales bacterium]
MHNVKSEILIIDRIIFEGKLKEKYHFVKNKMKLIYSTLKYAGKAPKLTDDLTFPPHEISNKEVKLGPLGELLAIGGDLSEKRMIKAYKNGISEISFDNEPLLWWTSTARCVILPCGIHISKIMRRTIKSKKFEITMDKAFKDVVNYCSILRKNNTWITKARIDTYCKLHKSGIAHSLEVWKDGDLAGGLFGVSFGAYFLVESKFAIENHASKTALIALFLRLEELGCTLFDLGIWPTEHLKSMGAVSISRESFLGNLEESMKLSNITEDWSRVFEGWDFLMAVEKNFKSVNK